MPTNQYLPWATGPGANVYDFATYTALAARSAGVGNGIADATQANTSWRQASVMAAAMAQFVVNSLGSDVNDDGDVNALAAKILAAIQSNGFTAASVAQILGGTDNTHFVTALGLKGAMAAQTLTDAATIAWNMNLGFRAKVTIQANRQLGVPTNLQEGATGSLQVIQGTGGSKLLTYAAGWDFGSVGVPVLSTTAGKSDTIRYEVMDPTAPVIQASFWKAA